MLSDGVAEEESDGKIMFGLSAVVLAGRHLTPWKRANWSVSIVYCDHNRVAGSSLRRLGLRSLLDLLITSPVTKWRFGPSTPYRFF